MSTFVLIHDAWHAGEVWRRVVPLLTAAGHTCHTPSLSGHGPLSHLLGPSIGLTRHVDDVADLIESENLTDVILVGHGYSGLVIEGVADRAPERIAQLVYLDAMIPSDGEAVVDIDPSTRALVEQATATDEAWNIPPCSPGPDGWFGVTEPNDIVWMQTFIGDESALCFTEPVRIRNHSTFRIPRSHIDCTRGPWPEAARRPLPNLQPNGHPALVWQLDAGHDSMVSDSTALVDMLLRFTTDAR